MNATFPRPGKFRTLPIFQAVVRRVGRRELGEVPVPPVELSGVDDDAADRGSVTSDELCGGVDHDVRTVVEGTEQDGEASCCRPPEDPASCATFETAAKSSVSSFGLPTLSAKTAFVFFVIAFRKLSGPSGRRTSPRSPVSGRCSGTGCTSRRKGRTTKGSRPRAGDVQQGERLRRLAGSDRERPGAPSSCATRCSNTSVVGFMIRV